MTAPLDFSSIGAKKPAPAPQKKAPKRRLPDLKTPKALIAAAALVAAAVVVGGYLVFGRSGTSPAAQAEKLGRYCLAAAEFDSLVPGAAPATEAVDTSAGAMSRLVREVGGTLSRMKADAPSEIRADVAATVTALEEAAEGKPAAVRSPSYQERRQRITAFGQARCSGEGAEVGSGRGQVERPTA